MESTTIGQQIKAARTAKGWTQTQLAQAMCDATSRDTFDQSWISQIETDARRPGAITLAALRAVLDINTDEMLAMLLDSAA